MESPTISTFFSVSLVFADGAVLGCTGGMAAGGAHPLVVADSDDGVAL